MIVATSDSRNMGAMENKGRTSSAPSFITHGRHYRPHYETSRAWSRTKYFHLDGQRVLTATGSSSPEGLTVFRD